jgi:hypothetical protein
VVSEFSSSTSGIDEIPCKHHLCPPADGCQHNSDKVGSTGRASYNNKLVLNVVQYDLLLYI